MDGYRTQLTGLDAGEAEALFLAGLPGPAAELGLGVCSRARSARCWPRCPRVCARAASLADQRFHLDARRWFEPAPGAPGARDGCGRGLERPRALSSPTRATTAQRVAREADAIALGLKAGLWYFVGRVGGDLRVYRVSRMTEVKVGEREFARDPGFDLRAFWDAWAKRFEDGLGDDSRHGARGARARRRGSSGSAIPRCAARRRAAPTPDGDGWLRRTLVFEKLEYAETALLGFGARRRGASSRPSCASACAPARAEIAALYAPG